MCGRGFATAVADPAFHDRVHPWDSDAAEDNLDARVGEDGIEQRRELLVPATDQEPCCAASSSSMTRFLGGPNDRGGGRIRGGAETPDPAADVLDHREYVHGSSAMTETFENFYEKSDIYSESYGNGFEFWTPYGKRQVDIAVRNSDGNLHLYEVKVNKSNYTKGQQRKDQWLAETYGFGTSVLRRSTDCPICNP
ncbi:hypothetical protein ACVDFE_17690 [Lentzea chajnantorensis]